MSMVKIIIKKGTTKITKKHYSHLQVGQLNNFKFDINRIHNDTNNR